MLWIRRWIVVRKKEHPLALIGSLIVLFLAFSAAADGGIAAGLFIFVIGALVLGALGIIG